MTYVEGFIVAVPTANKEAYRKHAADAAPLFREFGATRMASSSTSCAGTWIRRARPSPA